MRKVLAAVIILLMAGSLYAQCAKDCTKPCCAKKSEMTQCAKDCTKPCCAKKQGVGCEISACKTQASCGTQSDCSASSCSTPNCSKSRSNSRLDISGEVRYRFQWDGKDFNDDSSAPNYSELRTRLNFKFKPSYDTKVFLQLQDSRTLGEVTENDPLFGTPVMDGSADNLDLHQGYFQIQGLFGLCLDMQVGRMESAFGSERIMGNVGWSNIGRVFDGLRFRYNWMYGDIDVFNYKVVEESNKTVPDFRKDKDLLGVNVNFNMPSDNYKFQGYFIDETLYDFDRFTTGIYVHGYILDNFFHTTEFAYQFGTNDRAGAKYDFAGMMFAFDLGFKSEKFKLLGGFDFLSGDDPGTTEQETFYNGFATNHKFYGHMDYFLLNSNLGLQDIHVKFYAPDPLGMGLKMGAAYHIFSSNQDDANGDTDFGSELDLSVTMPYNKAVKFVGGYSIFMPGAIMESTMGEDLGTWFYFSTSVNF